MILHPDYLENSFSKLPLLLETSLYDMDTPEGKVYVECVATSDDMVSSGIMTQPQCSSFSPMAVCIELSDSDSNSSSSHCAQNEILQRRKKKARVTKSLSRLKIEKGTKELYLNYFGLVPNAKAMSIKEEVEHKEPTEVDLDCEIIGVEGLDDQDNVPMTSPRTPRTLMSQLSKDLEGSSRKRLFSISDAIDRISDSEIHDEGIYLRKKNIQGSLLGIDFSSFLGQRIRKHVKSDSSNHIIKNIESYCTATWIKNNFVEKLRYRQTDYPVTFRTKKKGSLRHRQCHKFKFTASERREFMKICKTGLNKESRRVKRMMKKVSVVLYRVAPHVIDEWSRPKPIKQTIWIDDDISIVEVEPAPASASISFGRNLSYPYNSHCQQSGPSTSRLYQEPRPQFLVKKDLKSSELVFMPLDARLSNSYNGHYQPLTQNRNLAVVNRRKQNFTNLRTDLSSHDDIYIKNRSSDEEESTYLNGSQISGVCFPFNYGTQIVNQKQLSASNAISESIPAVDFNEPQFSQAQRSTYQKPGPACSKIKHGAKSLNLRAGPSSLKPGETPSAVSFNPEPSTLTQGYNTQRYITSNSFPGYNSAKYGQSASNVSSGSSSSKPGETPSAVFSNPGPSTSTQGYMTSNSFSGYSQQNASSGQASSSSKPVPIIIPSDSTFSLKSNTQTNFPYLQKSLLMPLKNETQLAMANATNRQRMKVRRHNSIQHQEQLQNLTINDTSDESSLAIASVYSLSGGNEDVPIAHVNIEIGQIGSLTCGTESQVTFPIGIKPKEYDNNLIPRKPLPVSKMAEYIVERNVDSDTNEIVEVICIEDED